MGGLAKTVAELMARARSAAVGLRPSPLLEVTPFGANPGALKMLAYAPDELQPSPSLVVVLHGCGQTAAGYVEDSGWLDLADRYGFALLCPEQTRANNANLCFNWFEPQDIAHGGGEAASIAQMVQYAVAAHRIDPHRVFITGLSAGGAMTAVMLAAYPELFASGSIIAGLPYGVAGSMPEALSAMKTVPHLPPKAWGDKVRQANLTARRWPKVSIWHGDADTTVAPIAADALVAQWTDVHGLKAGHAETTASARHRLTRWRTHTGEVLVESHRLAGLGHGVPIAAAGEDGCGAAAPWVLEAGVSSSFEMACVWGLVGKPRAASKARGRPASHPSAGAGRPDLASAADVNAVIARALRSAGLS